MADSMPKTLADDCSLIESLRLAVPLYMYELSKTPQPERDARGQRWMQAAASRVGEAGDLLQFRHTKRFQKSGTDMRVATVFEHLAKGLAAGAVLYGEARFPGLVFSAPKSARPTPAHVAAPAAHRLVEVVELPEGPA